MALVIITQTIVVDNDDNDYIEMRNSINNGSLTIQDCIEVAESVTVRIEDYESVMAE